MIVFSRIHDQRYIVWIIFHDSHCQPQYRALPFDQGGSRGYSGQRTWSRHGGVLRTPADLNLFAEYSRPDIVRFFGVHYDPTKHNKGILWFDNEGVIITKLDTSGAVKQHQYSNRFLSASRFSWTSQNQMTPANRARRKVLDAESEQRTLRLFVQPRSHKPALYLGKATVSSFEHSGPMQIEFKLENSIPEVVQTELGVTFEQ